MTLFGNKDVAFRYLSNALAQTHDLTAFRTLNVAFASFQLINYRGSERDRVWIDACGSASKNIQIKRVVGAALALRWEKEKQVQEKKNI